MGDNQLSPWSSSVMTAVQGESSPQAWPLHRRSCLSSAPLRDLRCIAASCVRAIISHLLNFKPVVSVPPRAPEQRQQSTDRQTVVLNRVRGRVGKSRDREENISRKYWVDQKVNSGCCGCACAQLLQLCPLFLTPAGPLCPWMLQARILEWVAMPSRGSSWPAVEPTSPALQADSLLTEPTGRQHVRKAWTNFLASPIFLTSQFYT